MKRIAPICLAALSACSGDPKRHDPRSAASQPAATNVLVINFQSGFKNTSIELDLDHQRVFSEVLTTDDRIGLARRIKVTPANSKRIEAVITLDNTAHYSYQIQLDRGHYIGFLKDLDSGRLKMKQSLIPFVYD